MAFVHIGLSCIDHFFYVDQLPEENSKTQSYSSFLCGGGPAGNAAYVTGSWNHDKPTYLVARFGVDHFAEILRSEHLSSNVNLDYCIVHRAIDTANSSVWVNRHTGLRTIVTQKTTNHELSAADWQRIDQLINLLNEQDETHIVLIDGHEPELSNYIVTRLYRKVVVMDAGTPRSSLFELLPLVDYCIASERFGSAVLGGQPLKPHNYQQALEHLQRQLHKKDSIPVITLGELGGIYLNQDKELATYSAYKVEVVDTTGAGDIYHGAFMYFLDQGLSLEQALQLSSLTASLSVKHKGVRNSLEPIERVKDLYEHDDSLPKTKIIL